MKRCLNILYAIVHPIILLPIAALYVLVLIERHTSPAVYMEPEERCWKE